MGTLLISCNLSGDKHLKEMPSKKALPSLSGFCNLLLERTTQPLTGFWKRDLNVQIRNVLVSNIEVFFFGFNIHVLIAQRHSTAAIQRLILCIPLIDIIELYRVILRSMGSTHFWPITIHLQSLVGATIFKWTQ